MKITDLDVLEEHLDTLFERFSVHCRSIGFVADHIQDDQAMCSLMVTGHAMKETQNLIAAILGREIETLEGPY